MPETKKITAKITMRKRTAGLILLLLDEDGTGGEWDVCRGSESLCRTPWLVLIWEKTQVVWGNGDAKFNICLLVLGAKTSHSMTWVI